MELIDYSNFIVRFFQKINHILDNFVYNGYDALVVVLSPALLAAFTLYIAILGLSLSQGWIEGSFRQLTKVSFKFGLIYLFCTSWVYFSSYILLGVQGSAETIGMTLMGAAGAETSSTQSLYEGLQEVAKKIADNGAAIWATAGWRNPGTYFIAFLYAIFGVLSIIIAVIEIAGAQILLSLALATAPLFIAMTLFKSTHGFFDKWVGVIAGLAFTMIFVSAAVALISHLTYWAVDIGRGEIKFADSIVIIFIGLFGVKVITSVTQMAQSIGGAVSSASSSSLLAGAVGGAISAQHMLNNTNTATVNGAYNGATVATSAYQYVKEGVKQRSPMLASAINQIRRGHNNANH